MTGRDQGPPGLRIFPAGERPPVAGGPEERIAQRPGEWWLVVAAIFVAAALIGIAFLVR